MKEPKVQNRKRIKAVDFFCGGGGMSCGMQQAGIEVLAGVDYEKSCKETYEKNIKGAQFIQADVFKLRVETIENKLKIKRFDENLLLIGCSPCQFWSVINTDKNKSKKSRYLLKEFGRFVKYFKPGYVVVENVPGVLGKKKESGLETFIEWLEMNEYKVHFEVHNTNDYGVPQNRKRFTLVANRIGEVKLFPSKDEGEKLTVRDVLGEHNGFPKLEPGNQDKSAEMHVVANLTDICKERLQYVKKDGGSRFDFAHIKRLQLKCFEGKDNSFRDTFGRLWWDKPSPTITTKFFSISNGRFAHPEENRALSLREGATLQTFPYSYEFIGTSIAARARMIGNAVPPEYARRIGKTITNNHYNG
jgi:DNA (cytosine-5)-methyltransferase 1